MAEALEHRALVRAWMDRAAADRLPADRLIELFDAGFGALWRRAHITLGEVTLMAVLERVLYNASERFAMFSALGVGRSGLILEPLRGQPRLDRDELEQGIRFILEEFLTVLGNLTSEILTPALHAELTKVQADPLRPGEEARAGRGVRKPGAARRRKHE